MPSRIIMTSLQQITTFSSRAYEEESRRQNTHGSVHRITNPMNTYVNKRFINSSTPLPLKITG